MRPHLDSTQLDLELSHRGFEVRRIQELNGLTDDDINYILRKRQETNHSDEFIGIQDGYSFGGSEDSDLLVYRESIEPKYGERFQAHGIAKMSAHDQVRSLNNLIINGADNNRRFYTSPLKHGMELEAAGAMGSEGPYTNGLFIVVGEKDGIPEALEARGGIKYVILNDSLYETIDFFQKKFPNVTFIKAINAPEAFKRICES